MTTEISPEILDISAVVTGEARIALQGWQLDLAMRAMTALGHSTAHIAWSVRRDPRVLRLHASKRGVQLNPRDTRVDWQAVEWVASGIEMPLTGVDRHAAIRVLAKRGRTCAEIADRLCTTHDVIFKIAARIGVALPVKESEIAQIAPALNPSARPGARKRSHERALQRRRELEAVA